MAISYSLLWVESWWLKKATFNWSKIGKGDVNAHLSPRCHEGQGGLERLLKGPSIAFRVIREDYWERKINMSYFEVVRKDAKGVSDWG